MIGESHWSANVMGGIPYQSKGCAACKKRKKKVVMSLLPSYIFLSIAVVFDFRRIHWRQTSVISKSLNVSDVWNGARHVPGTTRTAILSTTRWSLVSSNGVWRKDQSPSSWPRWIQLHCRPRSIWVRRFAHSYFRPSLLLYSRQMLTDTPKLIAGISCWPASPAWRANPNF